MPGFGDRGPPVAVNAERLWRALKTARENGLTATEAAGRNIASSAYARRTMQTWVRAGLATYTPAVTMARDDSGRFYITADAPTHPPVLRASGVVEPRAAAMTVEQFAAIRRTLGLSLGGLASALGWNGSQPSRSRAMKRFESGERPIDARLAAKVKALVAAE